MYEDPDFDFFLYGDYLPVLSWADVNKYLIYK